ncbi:cytochrome P450 [Yinghuangia soli]|uniref:Cytochrome P450 n=1 Tax=Yinghuangia soli TaxID=2908204 RepID=A0AA41PUF0_9ACTN|nr:cytochrome P450 [Yinghuangia soli]MCF2525896.1 cytochrome P450 [Yinghuangia soli]
MTVTLRSVPRAPGRIPLLGHVLPLARRPFGFLEGLGDTGGFVRVDLGTSPVYFVTTPELINEVLVAKSRDFDKGRLFDRARAFIGNGLTTSSGEVHRRNRRLMQPVFHHERIAGYADIMGKFAVEMIEPWQPGSVLALDQEIYQYTLNTATETLFATELDPGAAEEVRRYVPVLIKEALTQTALPEAFTRMPFPANRRFDKAVVKVRAAVQQLIALARTRDPEEQVDLLSTFVLLRDAETGDGLTDEELGDEIVTFIIGGTETTASTLAWTFHELARHPEVEARVVEEIDAVVGDGPIGIPEIGKLEYLNRVVDEVSRLHSFLLLMRRARQDVVIGDVELPVGTEIAFSPYAMHRDARVYDDPARFDPDRWLPDNKAGRSRADYIPFGAGPRKCIGEGYARMQMSIVLATVLSRWQLRPVESPTPVRDVVAVVPRPNHLPMVAEPRVR